MKEQLLLLQEDVKLLSTCIKGGTSFDKKNADKLKEELTKGLILQKEEFPDDVVRLNSFVKIQDRNTGNIIELILVLPDKAAINNRKISVLAPLGTALLGYRQGQVIRWEMPVGEKTFRIVEVKRPEEE